MENQAGVREVKARLSRYIDIARRGADVIITDRGEPVARLSGIEHVAIKSEGDVIAELVEAGLIEPAVGVAQGAKPLKARRGASITKAVRDARR